MESRPKLKEVLEKIATPVAVERASDGLIVIPQLIVSQGVDEAYLCMTKSFNIGSSNFLYLKPKQYREYARKELDNGKRQITDSCWFEDEMGTVKREKVSQVTLVPYHDLLERMWDNPEIYEGTELARKLIQPITLHYNLDNLIKTIRQNRGETR
jgi:hypothetical protein